jgi:methionyl-tRNA formyltransferase
MNNIPKRVLFLGFNSLQTRLIDLLIKLGCNVDHTEKIIDGNGSYDFVVSFGYRYILRKNIIKKLNCPIFNLHISYLPYNRGAHPNFWAFYEKTPSGVTIHLIDEGVDTGSIIYQRYVNFDKGEITFFDTYTRLLEDIEMLFEEKVQDILNGNWVATPQSGVGTIHLAKDLPSEFLGWNSVIVDEVRRLEKIYNKNDVE